MFIVSAQPGSFISSEQNFPTSSRLLTRGIHQGMIIPPKDEDRFIREPYRIKEMLIIFSSTNEDLLLQSSGEKVGF